jgi:hypothetical protein
MDDLDQPHDDDALDQGNESRLRERNKKRRQRAAMTDEERQAVRAKDAQRKRRSQP